MSITIPFFAAFPAWLILAESVHWNLAKGNMEEVKKQLRKIAKFNKVHFDENSIDHMTNANGVDKRKRRNDENDISVQENLITVVKLQSEKTLARGGVKDLFSTPKLRLITICISFLLVGNMVANFGLQTGAESITNSNIYLTSAMFSLVEIPACLSVMFLIHV